MPRLPCVQWGAGVLESQYVYMSYFTAGFLARSRAVHVRAGRHPKQGKHELGEFGAGRPGFGGRWALGQKKKGCGGAGLFLAPGGAVWEHLAAFLLGQNDAKIRRNYVKMKSKYVKKARSTC